MTCDYTVYSSLFIDNDVKNLNSRDASHDFICQFPLVTKNIISDKGDGQSSYLDSAFITDILKYLKL